MASPTPSLSRSRRSRGKWLLGTAVVLVVLIATAVLGAAAWFHHAATAALPQLDGTINLAGLSGPVTVTRDAHGVPHIAAANMEDLLFAQGFVTAQDRLWQMDLNRRFGRGELAEIFGERALLHDQQQRTLRLQAAAQHGVAALSERDRKYLEAYARGVNALIERQMGNLPIEFRILGYSPRPWTIADSLICGINITQTLNSQWETEYWHDRILSKMGAQLTADLYPTTSWHDRPPSALPRTEQFAPAPVSVSPTGSDVTYSPLPGVLNAGVECDSCFPGSNNWVVSGEHTTTGKPLLSNDMHLMHTIPNFWYEVQLKAEDYDVAGVSTPGLPMVIAGHNRRIAWGFTNVGPDVQDLYLEKTHGGGEYLTPTGWKRFEESFDTIHVKGKPDVVLKLQATRHGPVISDLLPDEHRVLALKWTLYDPATLTSPFYDIGRAQDWQQFRAAFSKFGGPGQNVVYADVDGHIGYQATGFTPVRVSGDGLSISPGEDDRHEWTGYIPFDKLPSVFDPASGVLATANGRITPDGYPYLIASQWGAPYRQERIYKVLESGKKFSASDMLALQLDTYSEFDHLFAGQLVYAVDHTRGASRRARQAADIMRKWNGRVEVDSVAPTIAARARRKLWRLLLEPRLGADWLEYSWFSSSVALEKLLITKPARWLPPGVTDFNQLLTQAVEEAVSQSSVPARSPRGNPIASAMADKNPAERNEKPAPSDLQRLKWGENFPVELNHPIFGAVPFLRRFSGPGRQPQSGNGSLTVKAAGRTFGASERATYDLSDLDASTLNIVTGESGQIFSPYYLDQWQYWYGGKTFALPYSDSAVKAAASHTLTLEQ